MEDKYLPIGTVVQLKNGKKPIMIIGYKISSNDNKALVNGKEINTTEVYDYAAVLYPEGIVDSNTNIMFNHSNIEKIIYKGYVSEESEFISRFIKDEDAKEVK